MKDVLIRALVSLAAAATLAGCATFANDSAPAPQPGYVYVAGARNAQPAIWLCPTTPGKGECARVEVTEVDQ